jgi:hypothetical protein
MQEHTDRERALHIRAKLAEELETLLLLQRELKNRPDQDNHERVRADCVSVAIGHLQQAMSALEMASRDYS